MRKEIIDLIMREGRLKHSVHRGAVDWTNYPFDEFPRALCVLIDDTTLFQPDGGFDNMNLSIEVACRMPESPIGPDDNLFEDIRSELQRIILVLLSAADSEGDALVVKADQSARLVEFHDTQLQVQGVAVTLNLTY